MVVLICKKKLQTAKKMVQLNKTKFVQIYSLDGVAVVVVAVGIVVVMVVTFK